MKETFFQKNIIVILVGLFTVGGYIFEVRSNSSELKVLKTEFARKDVIAVELSGLRSAFDSLSSEIKKAQNVSEKNQELLNKILLGEIKK